MAYEITVYISVKPNMRRTLRWAGKEHQLFSTEDEPHSFPYCEISH